MQNRVDIKDYILNIENDFPVNKWKIDGVHLWPILRIRLFFYLIDKVENKQNKKEVNQIAATPRTFKQKLKIKIRSYLNVLQYYYWKQKLPQKDYIFVGSDAHRVNYKGGRFNRFFDVLIEKENLKSNSLYLEYGPELDNQYNAELVYKFNKPLKGFVHLNKQIESKDKSFSGYSDFLYHLESNFLFENFVENYSEKTILYWFDTRFAPKILFFKNVLLKIQPKEITVLCYYSEDIFALIAAANQLNIKTIEMQHGPQTDIHLSYGSWSVIPKEGYDVLPRTFWCWDNYSKTVLDKWIKKNKLYQVEVKGNPWVDYWKKNNSTYKYSDFILYSLQPNPITHGQLFIPEMIELIKESNCLWFIRLHPRQLNQMSLIKELLERENILNLVNLEDATKDALPVLLANAKLHITHFSGATLEAEFFGLKTILINETGLKSFPHLIERNEAQYVDYRDANFKIKMLALINKYTYLL